MLLVSKSGFRCLDQEAMQQGVPITGSVEIGGLRKSARHRPLLHRPSLHSLGLWFPEPMLVIAPSRYVAHTRDSSIITNTRSGPHAHPLTHIVRSIHSLRGCLVFFWRRLETLIYHFVANLRRTSITQCLNQWWWINSSLEAAPSLAGKAFTSKPRQQSVKPQQGSM